MNRLKSDEFGKFFGDDPLISASMRVTRGCNLRCEHCYAGGGSCLKNELKTEEITKVVKSLSDSGCLSVFFTGGEPFLRKDIIEILQSASDAGMSVLTSTNGVFVKREHMLAMKKMKTKLFQVSLDSPFSIIHDNIRGVPGTYEKAVETVKMATEIIGENIAIGTVLMKKNYLDMGRIMRKSVELGADHFALNILLRSGRAEECMDPTTEEKNKAISDIFNTFRQLKDRLKFTNNTTIPPFMIPMDMREELCDQFCFCSFPYLLAVESDGSVAPCDGFLGIKEFNMGNVRDKPLNAIWEKSPVIKKLRAMGPNDLKGVCGRCIFKESCMGGCRASAYVNYKDIRMPDPVCQRAYETGLFPKDCLK